MMISPAMRARSSSTRSGERWRAVSELAERQHGVVHHPQLIGLGASSSAVGRWAAEGRLHVVHHGVYAVGHRQLPPWGPAMAGVLAAGEEALASHTTAAALWGIRRSSSGLVRVLVPMARGVRTRRGLVVHHSRTLVAEDRAARHGIPVTSVARTLSDLGALLPAPAVRRAFASAEREGLLDMQELGALLERQRGGRGPRRLREVVRCHDPRWAQTRSGLELAALDLLAAHQLRDPEVDVWIDQRFHADLLWRREHVILEVDGRHWHTSAGDRRHDAWRARELRRLGFTVLRASEEAIEQRPSAVAARVQRALERAR
jgi:very-short-patch-repair endonuclease